MSSFSAELARAQAEAVVEAFESYRQRFQAVARHAVAHFDARDWPAIQDDAHRRLDLYTREIGSLLATLADGTPPDRLREPTHWAKVKSVYKQMIASRDDRELAETFLNSVTRRVFATVGVDPRVEFTERWHTLARMGEPAMLETHRVPGSSVEALQTILAGLPFTTPFVDATGQLDQIASIVDEEIKRNAKGRSVNIDVLRAPFVRNKGAYLVGRIRYDGECTPLVLAILNGERGLTVDAVLLDRDEVSILFSFTRSYFLVDTARPRELVGFLHSILPHKPLSELYTAVGFHKHGKTELYRELMEHFASSDDHFVPAPGTKGMVMSVFVLPSCDVVFKVIRDHFDPPKSTTRKAVMASYELVFAHDRVGRLVDTQEFEHLAFERRRFDSAVLDELLRVAPTTVTLDGDSVVLAHLYTERRLVPLNLYVQQASPEQARAAVIDFGQAIKDLAAANIFPGDTQLKNFGVTRHGRVAFYDYDEVALLTSCVFRRIPRSRCDDDELSDDTWFAVGERDIFPEEFRTWLGLSGELREAFEDAHGDLFDVEFWLTMQQRLQAGEIADVIPYPRLRRLKASPG